MDVGSKAAARLILDIANGHWNILNGFHSNESVVVEEGIPTILLDKAASKSEEAEPQILSRALLAAIKALPDMGQMVNRICNMNNDDALSAH